MGVLLPCSLHTTSLNHDTMHQYSHYNAHTSDPVQSRRLHTCTRCQTAQGSCRMQTSRSSDSSCLSEARVCPLLTRAAWRTALRDDGQSLQVFVGLIDPFRLSEDSLRLFQSELSGLSEQESGQGSGQETMPHVSRCACSLKLRTGRTEEPGMELASTCCFRCPR